MSNACDELRGRYDTKTNGARVRERGFRAALRFYRRHFRSVLTLSIAFYLAIAALVALSIAGFGFFVSGFFTLPYLAAVSIFWLQAPLARLMEDIRAGRSGSGVQSTFAALSPRMGSITGGSLLACIGVLCGLYLFIVPGIFLLARWALLIPSIVIEDSGAFRAFARSNRLVRGHTSRVVVELLVGGILLYVIASITLALLFVGTWVALAAALAFLALTTPPIPLMRTLSYYDLREVADASDKARIPAPTPGA